MSGLKFSLISKQKFSHMQPCQPVYDSAQTFASQAVGVTMRSLRTVGGCNQMQASHLAMLKYSAWMGFSAAY